METHSLIIQCGTRKAIITGKRVSLLKMHNKKKDELKVPEAEIEDQLARFQAAFLWATKGFIDMPEFKSPKRYYQ